MINTKYTFIDKGIHIICMHIFLKINRNKYNFNKKSKIMLFIENKLLLSRFAQNEQENKKVLNFIQYIKN